MLTPFEGGVIFMLLMIFIVWIIGSMAIVKLLRAINSSLVEIWHKNEREWHSK